MNSFLNALMGEPIKLQPYQTVLLGRFFKGGPFSLARKEVFNSLPARKMAEIRGIKPNLIIIDEISP